MSEPDITKDISKLVDVSTDELLDEVFNRFGCAVFIGEKQDGYKELNSWWRSQGNKFVCYGMTQEVAMHIQAKLIKEEIESDSDEEEG